MSEEKYWEIVDKFLLANGGKMPRKGIYLVEVAECHVHATGAWYKEVAWGFQIVSPTQRRKTMGGLIAVEDLDAFEYLEDAFAVFGIRLAHMREIERACQKVIGKRAFVEVKAHGELRFLQPAKLRRPRKPFSERMSRDEASTFMNLVGLGYFEDTLDHYTFPEEKNEEKSAA